MPSKKRSPAAPQAKAAPKSVPTSAPSAPRSAAKAPKPAPKPATPVLEKDLPLVAVVADVHIANHSRYGGPVVDGLNRRGHETLGVLRRAVQEAVRQKVLAFVVAGDLFHSARPEPALIRGVQDIFAEARREKMRVVLVPGNHDMPDDTAENGNTAMAPLYEVATVVRAPEWQTFWDVGFLLVPYYGRMPMTEHLSGMISGSHNEGENVLISHVGIYVEDARTPVWQRRAKDAIAVHELERIMAGTGIQSALVGNYHDPLDWRTREGSMIIQIGTLCPATFGDEGLRDRGRMVVLGQSMGKLFFHHKEIPGPRFLDLEEGWQFEKPDCHLIVDKAVAEGNSVYARLPPGEVAPQDLPMGVFALEEREAKAESPEESKGEVANPQEAIAQYVAEMSLPEGADRNNLLGRVQRYWKAAS